MTNKRNSIALASALASPCGLRADSSLAVTDRVASARKEYEARAAQLASVLDCWISEEVTEILTLSARELFDLSELETDVSAVK